MRKVKLEDLKKGVEIQWYEHGRKYIIESVDENYVVLAGYSISVVSISDILDNCYIKKNIGKTRGLHPHCQMYSLPEFMRTQTPIKKECDSKKLLSEQYPHYYKDVSNLKVIDVYRVLELFEVNDPCIQHAIKKLLAIGNRGVKDHDRDFREIMDTLKRYEEMRNEDAK